MGKAARRKAARRQAPPPVGKEQPRVARAIWATTAGVAAVVAIVVVVLVATRRNPETPPPAAAPSAADQSAPASLVRAANAVGFRPNTEPGVGQIEGKPVSAAQPPSNGNLLRLGSEAPSFTLKTPQGETVSLRRLRGKTVLLEFFATWCPHCAAEAPHLDRLSRSLPKKDVAFVSVNADGEDAASVFAYHRYFGLDFRALLDPSSRPGSFANPGAGGPTSEAYNVETIPTFYVLDRKGRITWRSDGEQPDALLRRELLKAAARGA